MRYIATWRACTKRSESFGSPHFLDRETVEVGDDRQDRLGLQDDLLLAEIGEVGLGELEGDGLLAKVGEGAQHGDGALELTDVVAHALGDPLGHVVGKGDALAFGLRTKDRDAGLEVGLIDLGDESLEETATETILESGEVAR